MRLFHLADGGWIVRLFHLADGGWSVRLFHTAGGGRCLLLRECKIGNRADPPHHVRR